MQEGSHAEPVSASSAKQHTIKQEAPMAMMPSALLIKNITFLALDPENLSPALSGGLDYKIFTLFRIPAQGGEAVQGDQSLLKSYDRQAIAPRSSFSTPST